MNKSPYKDIYKILVVGDQSVGKTSMTLRFVDNIFNKFYYPTIGVDFKFKDIDLNGQVMKLQIWDTSGLERFRSLSTQYYRGAMGVLFVYDITCFKSFQNIPDWVKTVREYTKPDVELILVGSKCDLDGKRQVPKKQGEQLAAQYGMRFMETSAESNENIGEAFLTLARDIHAQREETQRQKSQREETQRQTSQREVFVINDSASEQNSTGDEEKETGFIKLAWQSVKNESKSLRTKCCQS